MTTNRNLRAALVGAALTMALATVVHADHLECSPIKDSAPRATYTADLTGLAANPCCIVKVPAKLLCVDTTKTNVNPPPPGGGPTGGNAGKFVCYRIKCPRTAFTPVAVADQFGRVRSLGRRQIPRREDSRRQRPQLGDRLVQPRAATMLCAPSS